MRDGWVQADVTEQDRKVDLYTCERDMRLAQQGPPFFRRCMEAKGYIQQQK